MESSFAKEGRGLGRQRRRRGSARHATTRTLEPGALQTGAAAQGGGGGGEREHGCGDSSHANAAGGSPASLNPKPAEGADQSVVRPPRTVPAAVSRRRPQTAPYEQAPVTNVHRVPRFRPRMDTAGANYER